MKTESLRALVEKRTYQVQRAKEELKRRLIEWGEAKADLEAQLMSERALRRVKPNGQRN